MSAAETKQCPFCAETIKAAAVVCRFCGRDLAPAGPSPQPAQPGGTHLEGELSGSTPSLPPSEVFDLLTALVQKSLVVYEEDEQGHGRYRLLETVRQYARDRLLESQEGTTLRQHHAAVFLAFAEEMVLDLSRQAPVAWLGRLEREYDNVRAALDWTLGNDPATALRLASVMARFWQTRSQLTEGRQWLERALEADRDAPPMHRARALIQLSRLMHWQGDYTQIREVLEEGRALAQQAGDKESLAFALGCLALEAHLRGEESRAGALMQESAGLLGEEEVEDPWMAAASMVAAAGIAASTSTNQTTAGLFREAQAACRAIGDPFLMGSCCRTEAFYALQRGDAERALALTREGMAAAREVGHTAGIHNALEALAGACAAQDHAEEAARLMGAAEALREAERWLILPLWTELHEQTVASARAALGQEAFAAAWAEGRAMPLSQAIEYALNDAEGTS